ncbi:MAG TPA: CoA pyrophosphatase [Cellvibrio sp.]|nr:CoA pyrophosphatase [Cellvibrio sp.]
MTSALFDALAAALLPINTPGQARAAVILLLSKDEQPALLYTKRALHLRNHPGEVCFPGGMREQQDENLLVTALREMEEEIGLSPNLVQVLGRLPDFHTRAGTEVASFVACTESSYPLVPSPAELDSIFWVPLALFEREIFIREDVFERDGRSYRIPVYSYLGYEIWGFTAAITARLLEVLGSPTCTKMISTS